MPALNWSVKTPTHEEVGDGLNLRGLEGMLRGLARLSQAGKNEVSWFGQCLHKTGHGFGETLGRGRVKEPPR